MNLSLISCNIRFDNPADGAHAWPHRRDFLAETLLKHSPDIIATQEGRYPQLVDLLSLLPDYEIIDMHRSWIKERMYPTLFIKRGRFEFIRSEDLWLSETPDLAGSLSFGSTFPRLMTWTKLQVTGYQQNFFVVNTHLDHIQASTRLEQIKVLGEQIHKNLMSNEALLLLGDFNDSPLSPVRQQLQQEFPGLQDAWKQFHHQEESSHHNFNGKLDAGSRIDWIMVDEKLKVVSCQMDKSQKQGIYPTDHFPIVCQISF